VSYPDCNIFQEASNLWMTDQSVFLTRLVLPTTDTTSSMWMLDNADR
jgi:hypothetical protein